eukprot:1162113-Pelagomonas_calceolata.AAC.21
MELRHIIIKTIGSGGLQQHAFQSASGARCNYLESSMKMIVLPLLVGAATTQLPPPCRTVSTACMHPHVAPEGLSRNKTLVVRTFEVPVSVLLTFIREVSTD